MLGRIAVGDVEGLLQIRHDDDAAALQRLIEDFPARQADDQLLGGFANGLSETLGGRQQYRLRQRIVLGLGE